MSTVEMSRYTKGKAGETNTMFELLERAAKRRFGDSIQVLKHSWATEEIDNLKFDMEIVAQEPIKESNRTIVDINMKEYTNRSEKEVDETLVRVKKTQSKTSGSRYCFSTTKGVNWGIGGSFGAQVMGTAMGSPNIGINAKFNRQKSTKEETETTEKSVFEFCYEQEENIKVPPQTQVKAKITTYSMKYQREYTLKLSLPKNRLVKVVYKTWFQRMVCGFSTRFITVSELCQTLPDLCEEDGRVSFIQPGTLSWVGEGSTIDKEVLPVSQAGATL